METIETIAEACGITLNEAQLERNPGWIKGRGDRYLGTGRTTLIALEVIRDAINSPGVTIACHDHINSRPGVKALAGAIQSLSEKLSTNGKLVITTGHHSVFIIADIEF